MSSDDAAGGYIKNELFALVRPYRICQVVRVKIAPDATRIPEAHERFDQDEWDKIRNRVAVAREPVSLRKKRGDEPIIGTDDQMLAVRRNVKFVGPTEVLDGPQWRR